MMPGGQLLKGNMLNLLGGLLKNIWVYSEFIRVERFFLIKQVTYTPKCLDMTHEGCHKCYRMCSSSQFGMNLADGDRGHAVSQCIS